MVALEIIFWTCAALVMYACLVYPLLIAIAARLWPRPVTVDDSFAGSVSTVLAVHNEESRIEGRLQDLLDAAQSSDRPCEIIVVSDGSTDETVKLAQQYALRGVRVIDLPGNVGKAAALTEACALAEHDILVFADARQRWAEDALDKMLRNFADPRVGAVSGDLVVESRPGVVAGVGLYWRFEKWLRRQESRTHSAVGVTGAISAVRRELFRPMPAGTILDDVYWPLSVVMQGYRVIHDQEAVAFDRLPDKPVDEFRRKVRTLSGNYQLMARLPSVLLPWRNPIWFQFLSHKALRLLVPWALIGLLVTSALLHTILYRELFVIQVFGYLLGLIGLWTGAGEKGRLTSGAGSFLVLNAAAWLAFWVWISGRAGKSWHKVRYDPPTPAPLTPVTTHRP